MNHSRAFSEMNWTRGCGVESWKIWSENRAVWGYIRAVSTVFPWTLPQFIQRWPWFCLHYNLCQLCESSKTLFFQLFSELVSRQRSQGRKNSIQKSADSVCKLYEKNVARKQKWHRKQKTGTLRNQNCLKPLDGVFTPILTFLELLYCFKLTYYSLLLFWHLYWNDRHYFKEVHMLCNSM